MEIESADTRISGVAEGNGLLPVKVHKPALGISDDLGLRGDRTFGTIFPRRPEAQGFLLRWRSSGAGPAPTKRHEA